MSLTDSKPSILIFGLIGIFIGGMIGYIVSMYSTDVHFHVQANIFQKTLTLLWIARKGALIGAVSGLLIVLAYFFYGSQRNIYQ